MKYMFVGATSAVASATLPGRASAAEAPQDADAVPDARLTAPLTVPASGFINVAFLISPDAEVVDFAGPWGVFEYVFIGDDSRRPFKLYTVAASRDPIKVSGGMTVVPNHSFADAPAPNVVVVPAMNTETLAPAALDWLRSVQKETDVTMSVCNGSYVLGDAGLLDGKKATGHHGGYGGLRVYPNVTVIRGVRYVEDGKIATSGGLTSGMDLAMRVVERYFGREVAKKTATSLEYQGTGWMYPKSNAQFAKKLPVGTAERPIDLVCELPVDKKKAHKEVYQGQPYYFCCEWCKKRFLMAPQRFAEPSR
jgi:transcriptional regulator GlxA family with amidase domain/YHS domain-containing protein